MLHIDLHLDFFPRVLQIDLHIDVFPRVLPIDLHIDVFPRVLQTDLDIDCFSLHVDFFSSCVTNRFTYRCFFLVCYK